MIVFLQVFEGNNGTTDIKNNTLNQRVMTKYMRIIPSPPDGKDTVCLRLSILGCKGGNFLLINKTALLNRDFQKSVVDDPS